jgi:hypothetical protein
VEGQLLITSKAYGVFGNFIRPDYYVLYFISARLTTHPLEKNFGLMRRLLHDCNSYEEAMRAMARNAIVNEVFLKLHHPRIPPLNLDCTNIFDGMIRGVCAY